MGQGTESSETCADRPTEVSVIRFVSKNHTIEEIAPKKEVYICKQRGCGKIFTNQEEYKNHEVFEDLKVKFICREPECGKELPDPGRMWWHYQEWHNSDTNVFVCPYTKCGSVHATNEGLEDHIESTHRQLPRIPTEPEIICFEGSDSVMEEDVNEENNAADCGKNVIKSEYTSSRNENLKPSEYGVKEENRIVSSKQQADLDTSYPMQEQPSKLRAALSSGEYPKNEAMSSSRIATAATSTATSARFPKNKDLLITKENFLVKYEVARSPVCSNDNSLHIDSSQDGSTIFINSDVSLTKSASSTGQEHRIDLGNLEKVFRNGFERDSVKSEDGSEPKANCSDDEEYTPKKQRISRSKQEPYKCEINGCGKTYKNKTHFRHHQDSHKLVSSVMNANAAKAQKQKVEKATSISFFLCKCCGAQLSNATALHKHYHETHANTKPPTSAAKSTEIYRCKVTGCDMEFATLSLLSKHFNEVHAKNSMSNANPNVKTGNGSGVVLVEQMYREDSATAASQRVNFKTDLKGKHALGLNEFADGKDNNKSSQSSHDKDDFGD